MSEPAVEVRNLGKRYRIAGVHEQEDTLCGYLAGLAKRSATNMKQMFSGGAADLGTEDVWALRNATFDVAPGEVLGVIGRNGAGKSTLLKILSRVTEPTEGRAVLRGRVGSLLEVGTGFHDELTGRENVFLSGAILGMTRREIVADFDEIVEFSGIGKYIDTPIKRYSSGMRVRLGFAVAAHLEPEILIIDEVLAVGDAEFRKKCLGKMGDVARGGRTVLFVSHSMAQIRRLCSRAVWIDTGCVRRIGDAHEVSLEYERSAGPSSKSDGAVFRRCDKHHEAIWIEEVRLSSPTGELKTDFSYRDDMLVTMKIGRSEADLNDLPSNLSMVWMLFEEAGTQISADSMIHHKMTIDGSGDRVSFFLHNVPLYNADYYFSVGINHETFGLIDFWERAAAFSIRYCDPVGKGYERDRRSGFFHICSTWNLR